MPEFDKNLQYSGGLSETFKKALDKQDLLQKNPCEHKHFEYVGEEWTGRVWINVYRCKDCGKELV